MFDTLFYMSASYVLLITGQCLTNLVFGLALIEYLLERIQAVIAVHSSARKTLDIDDPADRLSTLTTARFHVLWRSMAGASSPRRCS